MRSEVQKFTMGQGDHLEYTIDLSEIKKAITDDTFDLTMKVWVDLNKVWTQWNRNQIPYAELGVSHVIDAKTGKKKLSNDEIVSMKHEMDILLDRQEKLNDRIYELKKVLDEI